MVTTHVWLKTTFFYNPPFFLIVLFHHLVNKDDWHLLAHAMASDFSFPRQFSQREPLVFGLGPCHLKTTLKIKDTKLG
jgi:hypothetical protein